MQLRSSSTKSSQYAWWQIIIRFLRGGFNFCMRDSGSVFKLFVRVGKSRVRVKNH